MKRLIIIPEKKLEDVLPLLKANLAMVVAQISADNLLGLAGQMELAVLARVVQATKAHELLLWAGYARGYDVIWSSLAPTEEVVGSGSAKLETGLVSEVADSGRTELRLADELQAAAWTNVERRRGRTMNGMAASPVFIAGTCVAVLTLVRYDSEDAFAALDREDAASLDAGASLLNRLLEDRIIRLLLGLEST